MKQQTKVPNQLAGSSFFQQAADLHRQGKLDRAERLYRMALMGQPDHFDARYWLGMLRYQQRRLPEALESIGAAVAIRPTDAAALASLGLIQAALGCFQEALANYDRSLALNPGDKGTLANRGVALMALKRPADALASFEEALARAPNDPGLHNNRGGALMQLMRPEEALASFDRALALKPDYAEAHDNKGIILTELGRFDEAMNATETAIKFAPRRVRSYLSLTLSRKLKRGDRHFSDMEALARAMPSLTTDEQVELNFALSKAFADIGDYERSFKRMAAGNALKRKQTIYDEKAALGLLEQTRSTFTGDLMRRREGERSEVPVFIVGMPRSGTTLIEQILASHPDVYAAGEIDGLYAAIARFGGVGEGAARFPQAASAMSGEQWRQLGASYVERLAAGAPAAGRITNKTPDNFRFIGLIRLALPNARIIHVRRDPMDTCVSCFSRLFVDNLPYAYDLGELGRYYRAYDGLMAHWRGVLPANALFEVQYEEVVADLETQARRIVAYCGLEWDARCLDFHRTERQVRTASAMQVRQPIYRSSVGRWRDYEAFLAPLLAELGPSKSSLPWRRSEQSVAA